MRGTRVTVGAEERRELESILRRQFIVRDQEDFITSFDPSDGDTLEGVVEELVANFHAPVGLGYENTDMVVWRDGRIVAIVRGDHEGNPMAILFTAAI
jgi:hypothetical protein